MCDTTSQNATYLCKISSKSNEKKIWNKQRCEKTKGWTDAVKTIIYASPIFFSGKAEKYTEFQIYYLSIIKRKMKKKINVNMISKKLTNSEPVL